MGGFYCDKCDKIYTTKGGLCSHKRRFHDHQNVTIGQFKCLRCGDIFSTIGDRNRHVKLDHGQDTSFSCEICRKVFLKFVDKHTHMRRSHLKEGGFFCPREGCARFCQTKKYLLNHEQTHLPKEQRKTVCCSICPKSFLTIAGLKVHSRRHSGKGIKCQLDNCDKIFPTKGALVRHSLTHSTLRNYPCTHCENLFKSRGNLLRHIKFVHSKIEKNYKCSVCTKGFKCRSAVSRHEKTHEDGRTKFPCPHCGNEYSENDSLLFHIRIKHNENNVVWHKCSLCQKEFSHRSYLRKHITAVHLPSQRLGCIFCPSVFKNKYLQRVHVHIHTREKPNKCRDCGKSYSSTTGLAKHRKVYHSIRIPLECPHCFKTFLGAATWKQHIASHTHGRPHKCTLCDFRARCKTTVNRHIVAKHTNEKHFRCRYCSFETVYPSCLKKHVKFQHKMKGDFTMCYFCYKKIANTWINYHLTKHTRELYFPCRFCQNRYWNYTDRKTHENMKHANAELRFG